MNIYFNRVKELQDFADDFNNQLTTANQRYIEKQKQIENDKTKKLLSANKPSSLSPLKTLPNRKQLVISVDYLKKVPSWKPPSFHGEFMDKEVRIWKHKHQINDWEIYRTNLVRRSYEKQENMWNGKNFVIKDWYGKEFDPKPSMMKSPNDWKKSLSSSGHNIITTFINQNIKKEQMIRNKEQKILKYKHSRPPPLLNSWKYSNHIIKEFSTPKADLVVSYNKPQRIKFLIKDPYRIPKKDGGYFDKDIHLL